jgi:hypothetical protein
MILRFERVVKSYYGHAWDNDENDIHENWRERMNIVLREQFKSIRWRNDMWFNFTDPADEAFFLVWSSDGIEI